MALLGKNNLRVKMFKKFSTLTALSSALLLVACSSSDDSTSSNGAVQFYNASFNSPATYVVVDDTIRSSAAFGEVSTRHSYNAGEYQLNLAYKNDNNDYVDVFDEDKTINIEGDQKKLWLLSGDFNQPETNEFSITDYDEDDKFKLGVINTTSVTTSYDVYIAKDDYGFTDANLVAASEYLTLSGETEHDEGYYRFFVTNKGETSPIFESDKVYFNDETHYVVMVRNAYAAGTNELVLDLVSNNSSVQALTSLNAVSHLRFYNSIDDYANTYFKAQSPKEVVTSDLTAKDTLTAYHEVDAATFTLSMLDSSNNPVVNNFVESVKKGQSITSIFYQHNELPRLISVSENLSPNSTTHTVQIVNLIGSANFGDISDIDIYFTEDNETIDDTTTYIKDLLAFNVKSTVLDDQAYDVTVTYTSNGQTISLLQQANVDFSNDGHYILILEPAADEPSGFKLTKINTVSTQ